MNSTYGHVVKEKRLELGLTQKTLAGRLGIEASHIAQIESGRRRPSLALIERIGEVLRLDPIQLFHLVHPEATYLLAVSRPPRSRKRDVWKEFLSYRALHARHKVTRQELRMLKEIGTFTRVTDPRHFVFILTAIRQASLQ